MTFSASLFIAVMLLVPVAILLATWLGLRLARQRYLPRMIERAQRDQRADLRRVMREMRSRR